MRKSIFDIVSESMDLKTEVHRIIKMSSVEDVLCVDKYSYKTLFKFVDAYCFQKWKSRGHCISVNDFLYALHYEQLKKSAEVDVNSMLTLVELVYNFWYLTNDKFDEDYDLKWCGNYYHLQDVMNDLLSQYNHKAYYAEETEQVFVIEDKEDVTAVAEIINQELALDIIKYNHRTLQGDIDTKKAILLRLGSELEPKRKQLHDLNSKLEDNLFFALNNLNLRHNNRSKKDKNYKEYVAKMRKDRLEKWYDEVYQMMLLAFLLIDNVDRSNKFDDLKTKIKGA